MFVREELREKNLCEMTNTAFVYLNIVTTLGCVYEKILEI